MTRWRRNLGSNGWPGAASAEERRNADRFFEELTGTRSASAAVRPGWRPSSAARPFAAAQAAAPWESPASYESDFAGEAKPSYLVSHPFLGNSVEVNPVMAARLTDAQRAIQAAYDALGPNHHTRVHFGGGQKTLREWAGILSARGWRTGSSTSKHASGSAVDLNYAMQPYIVTRTTTNGRTTLGGELAGASLTTQRQHAADVYDRALRVTSLQADAMTLVAPMHVRAAGESTRDAYQRLLRVSQAMNRYFRYALLEDHTEVRRRPLADIEGATEDQLLAAIPLTERQDETQAIRNIDGMMNDAWRACHPGWTLTPRQTYFRILRDYEHARIPWVKGSPVARPAVTRNPTRGFLHMIEDVVVALCDTGRLRWGAIDFGETQSGDVHHFDLGSHGGYTPDGTA